MSPKYYSAALSEALGTLILTSDQASNFKLLALRERTTPRIFMGQVVSGCSVRRTTFSSLSSSPSMTNRMQNPFNTVVKNFFTSALVSSFVTNNRSRYFR